MKKLLMLPVLLLTLFFTSCDSDLVKELRELDNIPVSAEVDIDYVPINLLNFPIYTDLDLRKEIEDELLTDEVIDQVDQIKLDKMTIIFDRADNQSNFDFAKSVTLGVQTNISDYKEIARIDNVPNGAKSLEMETTGDYVDEYVKSNDPIQLVVQFESTEDVYNLELTMDMKFDARIDPSL